MCHSPRTSTYQTCKRRLPASKLPIPLRQICHNHTHTLFLTHILLVDVAFTSHRLGNYARQSRTLHNSDAAYTTKQDASFIN